MWGVMRAESTAEWTVSKMAVWTASTTAETMDDPKAANWAKPMAETKVALTASQTVGSTADHWAAWRVKRRAGSKASL